MIFCFDLDGTITLHGGFGFSEIRVPWQFLWLALSIYSPPINKETLQLLKAIRKRKEKILILTTRPQELEKITRKYLEKKKVPYDEIFFLNPGPFSHKRKIKKAIEENADFFYDNNENVVREAKKAGIKSFLV